MILGDWISVDERFPEDCIDVLCCWLLHPLFWPDPSVPEWDFWIDHVEGGAWQGNRGPTHWMPMPMPPKV